MSKLFSLSVWGGQEVSSVVDCVVASVDAEVITLIDLKIVRAFGLGRESPFPPVPPVLQKYLQEAVDRKIVINLAPAKVVVLEEEIENLKKKVKAKFESADWERKLKEFGLEEEDLVPYLKEILLFEKIIALRFGQTVDVSLKEIEAYYQDVYRPEQEARGEKPLPIFQVLEDIESKIRKEKVEKQAAMWIENLRGQSNVQVNARCLEQNSGLQEKPWDF